MECTLCGSKTKVIDSRKTEDEVKRRRECLNKKCQARFTTVETLVVQEEPVIQKKPQPKAPSVTKEEAKEVARRKKVSVRRAIEDLHEGYEDYDDDLASISGAYGTRGT